MSELPEASDENFNNSRSHTLLKQLLAIEANDKQEALSRAAQLVAQMVHAEKTDIFLYDASIGSLVALGVSDTDLGRLQKSLGLDRLPIANKGRTVEVFETGQPYYHGQVDQDPGQLPGLAHGMGVRSAIAVPLYVGEERRGVLQIDTTKPQFFSKDDLYFLQDIVHWVGIVVHRAELVEQVRQDAQEASRRLTAQELVTVLAHDIRNYLMPIKARLGLLQRRADREQRDLDTRDLEGINVTLNRFERLISNLMDTARLSQGLFSLTWSEVDLISVIDQVVGTLHTPTVTVTINAPQQLPVWIDTDRLQQALENLLANAIRHSPAGGNVTINVEQYEESINILIQDQGPGISADLLPQLFQPFRSGTGSTGLGLGLYLANQVVKAHGGLLTVASTSSEGTSFLLKLPHSKQL